MVESFKTASPESLLKRCLEELSISVVKEQSEAFLTYLKEIQKWNKAYNLTSLIKDDEIIIKHFIDSLLYLRALPDGPIEVMDVGSGAGFPGIPIKIIRPEIRLSLVEPSRKKAGFLIHIVKRLNLKNVDVIEKRIEDVIDKKVDVVLTRALFDINDFYKKSCHVLKENGLMIVSKGPKVEKEIKEIKDKLRLEVFKVRLPLTNIHRYIVSIYPQASDVNENPFKTESEKSIGNYGKTKPLLKTSNICFNLQCRLRKAGCRGFEGCPGFKAKS